MPIARQSPHWISSAHQPASTQRQFESALVTPSEQVFHAHHDGGIAAGIGRRNPPDESELQPIATTPECRNHVTESALLECWHAQMPETGNVLLLEVRTGNTAAQALSQHTSSPKRAGGKTITAPPTGKPKKPLKRENMLSATYLHRTKPWLRVRPDETSRRRPAAHNTHPTPAQVRPQNPTAHRIRAPS